MSNFTVQVGSDGLTEWAAISSPEDYDDHDDEEPFAEGDLNQIVRELDDLIFGIPEPQTDPVFRFGDDGIVHMAPAPDRRSYVSDDDLLEELRRASADLHQSLAGTNAHTDLCRAIENYEAALLEDPISISRLYARGVRLENVSRSVRRRIEVEDLTPFNSETEQDLDSVLVLHATYIMSEEDGRRLADGAAAYRRTPDETVDLREAAEQISSAVAQRLDLFSEEVRKHVAEVAHDVGEGPHPDRSNQMAVRSIGNMMVGLLKKIGGVGAGAILGGAIATSAPGVAAIAGGASVIDAVVSFLSSNVSLLLMFAAAAASALFWLPPILRLLQKLRRGGEK